MSRPDLHHGFRLRPFRPPPGLRNPHLQTLLARLLRPGGDGEVARERWETEDGDFLDLDLAPDPTHGAPLVLILHGLEGSSRRRYVRLAMSELRRRGLRAVGLNFRSCSGEPNRTPRFYHSGETEDLRWVLEELRRRFPGRRLGAFGFSLGGNVLLKYLGEEGSGPALDAAVAVSVPFDLVEGTRALEAPGMGRLYSRYFLRSLQTKARAKRLLLEPVVDLERILAARTLREFDDAATAPLHGFPDAWTYYRECSSARFLDRIRTPTLLLQALDDPFLPREALPLEAAGRNPWLLPGFQPTGGHVGFLQGGRGLRRSFWLEEEAARYLAGALTAQR